MNSSAISVTVVIPVLNGASTLRVQLAALDQQIDAPPFRVIVVDNGSEDDSGGIARTFPATNYEVTVVSEGTRGINSARNAGVTAAPDGAVLLCDADDKVHSGWVHAMVAGLVPGTWVGGALDYRHLNDAATRLLWGAPNRSQYAAIHPYSDNTYGCNCGFWRSMWMTLGGFDTRISGTGGDETEFFQRAYASGFQRVDVPAAIVSYRLRKGLRGMLRQRYRQGRNVVQLRSLPGGTLLPGSVGWRDTLLGLCKRIIVAPWYLWSAPRRYVLLASMASHLGRLRGLVARAFRRQR